MKKISFGIVLFICGLSLFIAGCGGDEDKTTVYKNSDFGFTVEYPVQYQAKELRWIKESIGLDLRTKDGTISLQAMGAGTNYAGMPFDQYVKIAASVEIQNFEKLISIKSMVSEYGVKGYKTYWMVVDHEDTDKGPIDTTRKTGPIYYFKPWREKKLGEQPVKTIMLSFTALPGRERQMEKAAAEIAGSFRYLHSYKVLFNKSHHGKKYFVQKDKPFRIELVSNPTTGFNWFIDALDDNYFKVKSYGFNPSSSRALGAPGKSYWEMIPLKEGNSTIKLLYYRAWEGKAKAVDKYQVKIIIR